MRDRFTLHGGHEARRGRSPPCRHPPDASGHFRPLSAVPVHRGLLQPTNLTVSKAVKIVESGEALSANHNQCWEQRCGGDGAVQPTPYARPPCRRASRDGSRCPVHATIPQRRIGGVWHALQGAHAEGVLSTLPTTAQGQGSGAYTAQRTLRCALAACMVRIGCCCCRAVHLQPACTLTTVALCKCSHAYLPYCPSSLVGSRCSGSLSAATSKHCVIPVHCLAEAEAEAEAEGLLAGCSRCACLSAAHL
jgi:hypothetical protein